MAYRIAVFVIWLHMLAIAQLTIYVLEHGKMPKSSGGTWTFDAAPSSLAVEEPWRWEWNEKNFMMHGRCSSTYRFGRALCIYDKARI